MSNSVEVFAKSKLPEACRVKQEYHPVPEAVLVPLPQTPRCKNVKRGQREGTKEYKEKCVKCLLYVMPSACNSQHNVNQIQ